MRAWKAWNSFSAWSRPAQLLVGLAELVADVGVLRRESRRRLQVLRRFRGRPLGEQDLPEQVAGVRHVRLRLEERAKQLRRLVGPLLHLEGGREVLLRLHVPGPDPQLRAKGLLRLREPALLQVDDSEGGVRLRDVGLVAERAFQGLHRRVEVSHLRVGLADEHAQLRGVAVTCEEAGVDRLGLRRPVALHEGEPVGELQRRVRAPLGIVAQELGRLRVVLRVQVGEGEHPAKARVPSFRREGAAERSRRLVEPAGVEVRDAERCLHSWELGLDRSRLLDELGRAREPSGLGVEDAQVQGGPSHGGRGATLERLSLFRGEGGERRGIHQGQDGRRLRSLRFRRVREEAGELLPLAACVFRGQPRRFPEVGVGLPGVARLLERLAELVVEHAKLGVRGLASLRELQGLAQGSHGGGGLVGAELRPAEVIEDAGVGRARPRHELEGGEGFPRALDVHEGHAQLEMGGRIVGRDLELLAEERDRVLEPRPSGLGNGDHPQVITRAPRPRIQGEGRVELRLRPVELPVVAVRAAHEDVRFRPRPSANDLREHGRGAVRLLDAEVLAREREGQLRVGGGDLADLLKRRRGLLGPAVRRERVREEDARLHVPGISDGEAPERRRGPARLSHLQVHEGEDPDRGTIGRRGPEAWRSAARAAGSFRSTRSSSPRSSQASNAAVR